MRYGQEYQFKEKKMMKKRKFFRRNRKIEIRKSTGKYEFFSPRKLQNSLQYAGLSRGRAQRIVQEVHRDISPGDTTKDVFRKAYSLIRKESSAAAIHYSLKKSLQELGPTGFLFEKFVSKLFLEAGYDTHTDKICQGQWVRHEVDVIANKENEKFFVECKFHNHPGAKNDIKVALYVKARWDDLKAGAEGEDLTGFYLASNTAFSKDAIAYAEGTGLRLLGINAPKEKSFLSLIEEHKLYPITSLSRLKKIHRQSLLSKNIVLCKELLQKRTLLEQIGIEADQVDLLFQDIKALVGQGE